MEQVKFPFAQRKLPVELIEEALPFFHGETTSKLVAEMTNWS